MSKVMSTEQALNLIQDGDMLAISGFMMAGYAEEISKKLEEKFLREGHPNHLTLLHAAGGGNWAGGGNDHFAHEGYVKRIIGGHFGTCPTIGKLVRENKIEAYNFPQGVITSMMRNASNGKHGEITKVGLRTYIDPRLEGGRLNEITTDDLIEVIDFRGEEWLYYPTPSIQIGIIRGTIADENGNVSLEEEISALDIALVAKAAKRCGGKVIVQVKHVAAAGSLPANRIDLPGIFVDAVVVCEDLENNHRQVAGCFYDQTMSGKTIVPVGALQRSAMSEKKVVGRRAAMELLPGVIVNLGVGVPEMVSQIVAEEKLDDQVVMTTESGCIGGIPCGGLCFGASRNAQGAVSEMDQFDFYDGGGLDVTYLGLAQADKAGNINVSKFGSGVTGCGGFINISQSTQKVIYVGTFTAGGLKCSIGGGKLTIEQEGKVKKFVSAVDQITYSGEYGADVGQDVLYITERCVFRLVKGGLELIEIAPGIDLERDVLGQMEFMPIISPNLKLIPAVIFDEPNMDLASFWKKS